MDDYISRQAAIKILKRQDGNFIDTEGKWWSIGLNAAISNLQMMPAADVRPVVHGHWIDHGSFVTCSHCQEEQYGIDTGRIYCPNCGAIMIEE